MKVIILTKEQADKVRGRHGEYSALDPIEIEDGYFILPVDVLKDPEHREVLDELIKCQGAVIEESVMIDKKLKDGEIGKEKIIYSVSETIPLKQEWLPEGKKLLTKK